VAFFFVLFEHRSSSHFFGSVNILSLLLGAFLDVLVLALFFRAYAAQVYFYWHFLLLWVAAHRLREPRNQQPLQTKFARILFRTLSISAAPS
jgi:hypothetical protein